MRRLVLVICALWLSGCAWLQHGYPGPAPTPAVQQQMDRLFAQGAGALSNNDIDAAVAAWRQYVQVAPAHVPQARKVRGWLTLLEREAAKRFARRAAAGERVGQTQAADRLHVAVFPLQSQGPNAARDTLNRALLAMITTDLGKVPSITVLERERIDALLQEQRLAASGLVDPATMAQQARLLGAGTVVAGAVYNAPGPAGPGSSRYKINTAVSDVAAARVLAAQEADGRQAEFFILEKQIVLGILKALDIQDIPPAVNQVHTRSWEAYARFAAGLALLSEDRFDEARAAFRAALGFDPGFMLAEQALLDTPEQGATLEGIRAEVKARP